MLLTFLIQFTIQTNLFGWTDDDPEENYSGDTKRCSSCRKILPLRYFGFNRAKSMGRACTCKSCLREHSAKMRDLHAMHSVPDNHICPICNKNAEELYSPGMGNKTPFRLDHDHVTGAFRGFICDSCNTGMGKFRDNVELLKKAITYLTDT